MTAIKFEKATAKINLPDLKLSAKYELAQGGLPRNRPVEHFQLFDLILEAAAQAGIQPRMPDDLTIHSGQSMRINWPHKDQPVPVENLLIQRVYGIIKLGDDVLVDNETLCPAIAVVYSEDGITLGFGINVRICENMNIYGANLVTTKDEPYEHCMEIVKGWIQNMAAKWESQLKVFRRANSVMLNQDEIFRIYGKLFSQAVEMNEGRQDRTGLNVGQVTGLVKNLNNKLVKKTVTLWEMMQAGTDVLKPETSTYPSLLKVNLYFSNFLLKEFNIILEEPVFENTEEAQVE